jgi:hypothetical protein
MPEIVTITTPETVEIIALSGATKGDKGDKGDPGVSSGDATIRIFAHAGGYLYCGQAPTGSAESAAVWDIKRIADTAGVIGATATASAVKWDDHLTASYS